MAFHGNRGNRGNSRRRVPISAGSRGRGSFGHSRGRGRGRGARKPIFVAERNQIDLKSVEELVTDQDESVEDLQSEVISSDEDSKEASVVQPYAALLQSLAVDSRPPAKKRRLDTAQVADTGNRRNEEITLDCSNDADRVVEPEEGPELAVDGLLDEDESEAEDASDPFESHFTHINDDCLSKRLKAIQSSQWTTLKATLPKLGEVVFSIPEATEGTEINLPIVSGPEQLKLKQKLAVSISRQKPIFDFLEKSLAPCIFHYHDIFFCGRIPTNSESLRRLACLHAVNHVFKTRDRVIKNNSRLAKEDSNDNLDLRDQGFTRPKVLILLPTRRSCVKIVSMIISLCEPEQQENRKRFEDSYIEKEGKFATEKPEDFKELFDGNDDDMFRLGLKFTRKAVKYFSQFYNSDIILASPLGLRMAMEASENKKVEYDFLSSIEIVIVDQADALLMQNWEHMEFIFENLNLQPKEAHGCDFSRVRSWYLDNHAKYFRQNIVFTSFNTPELNTLFWNQCKNWAGKIKFCNIYPGAIQGLGLKVKQTFSRLMSPSFTTDPSTRFTYFTSTIVPLLVRHSRDIVGTLIFVPSYLDFVRVRNYFATSSTTSALSFGCISEYTSVRDVARARSHFLTGHQRVLIYTERAHHFRRYQLKGVKKVIMYGLPDNPLFYKEIVGGYLGWSVREGQLEPGEGKVRVIFSKWDILKLERVAGTERVGKMIREKGDTFNFI